MVLVQGRERETEPKKINKDRNRTLSESYIIHTLIQNVFNNQSGAAEAWWAHNPQVPGSKPGSDN